MRKGDQAGPPGRYGMLLATLITAYLISALTSSRWAAAVHVVFIAAMALLALRTSRLSGRGALIAGCATVASAAAAAICSVSASRAAQGAASIWSGLMLLLAVVIIVGRVIRLDRVTVQSLYAALSAYMLIGLMFASFYAAIDYLTASAFFADGQPADTRTFQYFSFVTMTTLGYGDFTAAGSFGRAVAVLEALTGQVFLATLVARLVSAFGTTRRRDPPDA